MREPDHETTDDRTGATLTVELGGWRRFEPDAIDKLERLTAAFKADLRQGRTPDPARALALLEGIGAAARAVEATNAELAAILRRGGRA